MRAYPRPTRFAPFHFEEGLYRYEVLRPLVEHPYAAGMMMAIRHPRQQAGESTVVVLKPAYGDSPAEQWESAHEEAELTSFLVHERVSAVLGVVRHGAQAYVVLEHDKGAFLGSVMQAALLTKGRLPHAFVAHVVAEVADTLAFIHDARDEQGVPLGVIHRAITPMALRLTYTGEVKLGDFSDAWSTRSGRHVTPPGLLRGGVVCAAPEVIASAIASARPEPGPPPAVDLRSDLFSLGLVFLEMLVGYHPLDPIDLKGMDTELEMPPGLRAERRTWLTLNGLAGRLKRFSAEALLEKDASIPVSLGRIAARATRVDRAERHATAKELRDELRLWGATHGKSLQREDVVNELTRMRRAVRAFRNAPGLAALEHGYPPVPRDMKGGVSQ